MSTTVREECEVGDLDPAGVLEAALEAEQAERRAALRKLELAYQWAVLHPATADTGVETPGGPALLADESLGGDGTPMVAAFTAEPFALALGISPSAGAQLIADALDLLHRHPLLWKRLARLEVPAWQARRIAQQTHRLPLAGAIWVDQQLATVVIQPVLNMARGDAVDVHDPPPWMRELVMLRDGHCIFPRCTIDARSCDLDHTIPYQPNGPPGQTRPDNLACLCRRHHRAKTNGLWRYTRLPDDGYLWHGPHAATYLVTDRGTQRL